MTNSEHLYFPPHRQYSGVRNQESQQCWGWWSSDTCPAMTNAMEEHSTAKSIITYNIPHIHALSFYWKFNYSLSYSSVVSVLQKHTGVDKNACISWLRQSSQVIDLEEDFVWLYPSHWTPELLQFPACFQEPFMISSVSAPQPSGFELFSIFLLIPFLCKPRIKEFLPAPDQ